MDAGRIQRNTFWRQDAHLDAFHLCFRSMGRSLTGIQWGSSGLDAVRKLDGVCV